MAMPWGARNSPGLAPGWSPMPRRYLPDATVCLVRHVHAAGAADRDAARPIHLTVARARLAPLAKQLAVRVVHRNPIWSRILAQPSGGKVADVQVTHAINGDTARVRQDFEVCQSLAVGIELLHAVVVVVGDEDFVGLIDRNPNREVKLAGFGAFLSPLEQEANRF